MNLAAFRWGRRTAFDRAGVDRLVAPSDDKVVPFAKLSRTLDEIVASRVKHLTGYQNAALARRYQALVEQGPPAPSRRAGKTGLAEAVARNYAKLLAYKDEYEVARLHADTAFQAQLNQQFEGDYRLKFHLAPPLFASRDPTHRPSDQAGVRRLDAAGLQGAGEAESACAARRSTSSATPRSARSSGR